MISPLPFFVMQCVSTCVETKSIPDAANMSAIKKKFILFRAKVISHAVIRKDAVGRKAGTQEEKWKLKKWCGRKRKQMNENNSPVQQIRPPSKLRFPEEFLTRKCCWTLGITRFGKIHYTKTMILAGLRLRKERPQYVETTDVI